MPDRAFPPIDNNRDDTADLLIAYQKDSCFKEDPERLARFYEAEQARFMYASKPYMGPNPKSSTTTPFFEPMDTDDDRIILANRNECGPLIDGAISRLIGSTAEPTVVPDKPTTVVHRAAKKAKTVLDDILLNQRWLPKHHQDARNVSLFGTSWMLAGWETDFLDTKKQPAKVLACSSAPVAPPPTIDPSTGAEIPGIAPPACGWVMLAQGGEPQADGGTRYSGKIAREMAEAGVGVSVSLPEDEDENFFSTLHECPECKAPLKPRRALPTDVGTGPGMDAFGYDLTEDAPLPKAFVQVFPDTDVFPIGFGRTFDGFMPEVTIETIVPKDWLIQRYEHAEDVEAVALGEIEELARYHPSGLETWGYAGQSMTTDQKRWAPYRITIRQPWRNRQDEEKSEPLGRLMISANKTVLYNGPLMFEYTTITGEKKKIPRMRLFPFANETGNNTVNGNSDMSRLVGPQKALDAMLNQFCFDMAENGSPTVAVPKGADLEGQGDGLEMEDGTDAIPNRRIRYDPDAGPPQVIGGKVTHQDWQPFVDGVQVHMERTLAQSQLDMGKAASGAPAASAQMYLGQRLDETRKPKGQRWADRLQDLFSYLLEIVCAVYTDRRHFKVVDKMDNREVRDFAGADLMGQFNVRVAVKPAHDNEAFQRQNIIETLPLGLIDISTPRQRLKVAKILGIEDEVDAEPNQQVRAAENQWMDFTLADPRKHPVAKKRTDNHTLMYQQNMEDLRSPAGEQFTRMWDIHELATDGWYDEFKAMMMAEKKMKTPGMAAPDPKVLVDPFTGGPDTKAMMAQAEAFNAEQTAKTKIETKIPKNVQQRIQVITEKMIEAYPETAALNPDDKTDLLLLNEWLALCEARLWYSVGEPQMELEIAQAKAAASMATPAGPGAPPTPGGPAPGAPPAGAPPSPASQGSIAA